MTVDLRTRVDSKQAPVDAESFFTESLPAGFEQHQALVMPGAQWLPLKPFCIETGGESWTLSWEESRLRIAAGNRGAAHTVLSTDTFADIVNDQTTPIALMSNALLNMPSGDLADFLNWWLVLRSVLDGRALHTPGAVSFRDAAGNVINPRRSFAPEDSDEDMRAFLEEVGYLHIKGLFTAQEMTAIEADYAGAASHYEKGDPQAWFATSKDGVEHLVRMEGFERYSQAALDLVNDERFVRIGRIPGIGHVHSKAIGNRVGALTKPIGVVKGISDVPWHKDCSLGRHSYECCTLTVGISVTGADHDSGQLRVLPGSHRALIWPAPCLQPGIGLEPLDLPTCAGDVTVHLSCTQHMSQPPVGHTRKVLYAGFGLRPVDVAAAQANRDKLNSVRSKTHTSISQQPGYLG